MADDNDASATGADDNDNEDSDAERMLGDAVASEGNAKRDELGEAGKKAIARERKARREAEARIKELEPLAAKAKDLEDANKSELERIQDQLKTAQSDGTTASIGLLRLEVALEKAPDGMPPARIAGLAKRLSGKTREDLEADAEELFSELAPQDPNAIPTNGDGRPREALPKVPLPNSENLRLDDETDPRKLAARLPRM